MTYQNLLPFIPPKNNYNILYNISPMDMSMLEVQVG